MTEIEAAYEGRFELINSILKAAFGSPEKEPEEPQDKESVGRKVASFLRGLKGK